MNELVKRETGTVSDIFRKDSFLLDIPQIKEIFLMQIHIAGSRYIRNIEEIFKELYDGEKLRLIREPDNPHDELAVRIEDSKGRKLGYIYRHENEAIANLLDAGKNIYGILKFPEIGEDGEYLSRFNENCIPVDLYMRD
ncbi:MAG: HIRAN domain-containing protein [Ruminococcus sp.]|nr:HIRAN domain-containing protein [Ruminococcus sp.]